MYVLRSWKLLTSQSVKLLKETKYEYVIENKDDRVP